MNLRGRNKVSPEFSMSSMTDIVFLLLVFFLLTSPQITPEALDLILPKAKGKTTNVQNVSVSINKELQIYVDKERVTTSNLEQTLKSRLSGVEDPTIILRAEEGVPIEKAVNVMDIANRNKYKIVLAVRPNEN
ncbi:MULTISPECIES: ExbD/TolR family protein [Croceibacter]|jgi:biopolymer transport protein ExbD|uniref:Putative tansport related protein n=1 Tax=Croceibacter atlanticus (strain ATCC BAA-628 / JCM 21780 / CIP 108009 / IAM 15332 / KCTC 12090 / HTCC2559) TaxID=216432 RepID=A3U851_CROAH|nr:MULTISPECIES: biopolymer transporter ExbD [Croceibacter]HAT69993.1 biopolymer transporter ExbD [Flavobacteriaceae bacterium]EAP88418.1 putative tansport related protein [Croceibacter atlanticus HTCC2559]MAM22821.1 biopolymer transporter ExbD [Croceibacter sp.]MBG26728.1 biopolymer transporter ExbD [Croceibacter sp.]MBW4969448.1 biopolymer transporter ExbD [Croceibacter atlanticus]|tara:strand:+ start:46 stop:444 length:399 start_codon:yes stop_codon:yes gene_type:complete